MKNSNQSRKLAIYNLVAGRDRSLEAVGFLSVVVNGSILELEETDVNPVGVLTWLGRDCGSSRNWEISLKTWARGR